LVVASESAVVSVDGASCNVRVDIHGQGQQTSVRITVSATSGAGAPPSDDAAAGGVDADAAAGDADAIREYLSRPLEPEPDKSETFQYGKHSGKTFAEVKKNHSEYLKYLQGSVHRLKPENMLQARRYMFFANAIREDLSGPPEPEQSETFQYGKHSGKTFAEVKKNHSEYIKWLRGSIHRLKPENILQARRYMFFATELTT
jgi:hypothetical protein